MTKNETIELFIKCEKARLYALAAGKSENEAHEAAKEVWNIWANALLSERKALKEVSGDTIEWSKRAYVDFSGYQFNIKHIRIKQDELTEGSLNIAYSIRSIPPAGREINLQGYVFPGNATFRSAKFVGRTHFGSTHFWGDVDFASTEFSGPAYFGNACFTHSVDFGSARFFDPANFLGASFLGAVNFGSASFYGPVYFLRVQLYDRVDFGSANFSSHANFENAVISGNAFFGRALFSGNADFGNVKFSSNANFNRTSFSETVDFSVAKFGGLSDFIGSSFSGKALFRNANFSGPALFGSTSFAGDALFVWTRFEGPVSFIASNFYKDASFRSTRSQIGIDLSNAYFGRVPDFTQSTLHRDPRLDNVKVYGGSLFGPVWRDAHGPNEYWTLLWCTIRHRIDRDAPAKFRELKRYAIQGQDHRSELQFHAEEIRTSRFVADMIWHPRFWLGVLYEIFSDFGRSTIRPVIGLFVLALLFAGYFLSVSIKQSGANAGYWLPLPFTSRACIAPTHNAQKAVRDGINEISIRTNATTEAWSLALKNAFVFINWDRADAARRNFGCLYGLTTDGRLTFPYVPSSVSFASLIQIILSSVLLFLLLLGVRNMLKLK